jgi:hypothetical protein
MRQFAIKSLKLGVSEYWHIFSIGVINFLDNTVSSFAGIQGWHVKIGTRRLRSLREENKFKDWRSTWSDFQDYSAGRYLYKF